jgi:aryl-alcohol dehydrogenase-like predicted oxidoreductase
MKLGLGTVQFGMNYGISNTRGKPSEADIQRTLDIARGAGIRIIDTAHTYGESEAALGRNLPGKHEFRIVTKTLPLLADSVSDSDIRRVNTAFHLSLKRLRQPAIYGLLVHRASDLLAKGGERFMSALSSLKSEGFVTKIGVSVSDQRELDTLLSRFSIDLIQLPLNILDQRLLESGALSYLKEAGIEIHARSAFLQGLLLMNPENLEGYFRPAREYLRKFHELAKAHHKTPIELALKFVTSRKEIDCVVIGVNHPEELVEILSVAQLPPLINDYSGFAIRDEAILNPARWPQ